LADTQAKRYHHGDLKAALIDGTADLLAERGVNGFSLAELSRRIGVSPAAPYRHFANRDELLVTVAARALSAFGGALERESSNADPPDQRLAAMASGWVRFAAEQPAQFSVVFGAGLDQKTRHPQLRQAYKDLEEMLEAWVTELFPDDPAAAEQLADAIEAIAHGYAGLLTAGAGALAPREVDRAARQAANSTRALINGSAAFVSPTKTRSR
jgi:AcrR family transcriptional regulator